MLPAAGMPALLTGVELPADVRTFYERAGDRWRGKTSAGLCRSCPDRSSPPSHTAERPRQGRRSPADPAPRPPPPSGRPRHGLTEATFQAAGRRPIACDATSIGDNMSAPWRDCARNRVTRCLPHHERRFFKIRANETWRRYGGGCVSCSRSRRPRSDYSNSARQSGVFAGRCTSKRDSCSGRGLWDATDAELLESVWQFRRNFEAATGRRSLPAEPLEITSASAPPAARG